MMILSFLRVALSFSPSFEGTEYSPGTADRIFNPSHADGFRSDSLWLIWTTVIAFAVLFATAPLISESRTARIEAVMSALWIVSFFWYPIAFSFRDCWISASPCSRRGLPGFVGDPGKSNEGILEAIQTAWHEEYEDAKG